jgi:hypothetical protein
VFDAGNATITAATGNTAEACVFFVDRGGAASADNLISYSETGNDIANLTWTRRGLLDAQA